MVWLFGAVLLLALICGCADQKEAKKDPFIEQWRTRAEQSKAFSPSRKKQVVEVPGQEGEPVSKPQEKAAAPERPLPTKKISMRIADTEVASLLRALARAVDINILINEKVVGRMDINIRAAAWDQVFKGILRTQGLTYTWEGDIIRIMTLEDMELDLKRESQKRGLEMAGPLVTRIVNVDYTDASKLKDNLLQYLTKDEEGKPLGSVAVNEHTNSLIVQAVAGDVEKIVALILELDRPTAQVQIEAHIIETTKETARNLGIQWGGVYRNGGTWYTAGANSTGISGQQLSSGGLDPTAGWAINFPAALTDGTGFSFGLTTEQIGQSILSLQLTALQEDGKLNILSSPSITTLDNHPAVIESGAKVPFQTTDEAGETTITLENAVLSLEVTPHVIDGRTLKLMISTKKDELDFSRPVAGNPTILTKKAETTVILADGQTTVIGGLNKETATDTESGIPGLKNIPVLGWLFKTEGKSRQMEEVLIFITPHILRERDEVEQQVSQESSQEESAGEKPAGGDKKEE